MNASIGVRLAVLDRDCTKALFFELGRCGDAQRPQSNLVAIEMSLLDTLLASALISRKARFIRDTAIYWQSTAHPARDVFTQPSQLVSSLVVVPLVHGDDPPLAALYLTLEAPNDFAEVQQPLLVSFCPGDDAAFDPARLGPALLATSVYT